MEPGTLAVVSETVKVIFLRNKNLGQNSLEKFLTKLIFRCKGFHE